MSGTSGSDGGALGTPDESLRDHADHLVGAVA